MTRQDRTTPHALLWDIDGTLIDTTTLIVAALDQTFRRWLSRSLPADELRAIIGTPLREQMLALGDPRDEGIDPAAMEADFIAIYEAGKSQERLIGPAIDTLIAGHRAGLPTALVTSKNLAELDNTLPRLGIADHIDLIVSADDVDLPKPDPEGVRLAVRRLETDPRRTVFIGDTIYDLRAGEGAGVLRCAVTWGAAPREALLAEAPDLLCDDPERLATVLGLAGEPLAAR